MTPFVRTLILGAVLSLGAAAPASGLGVKVVLDPAQHAVDSGEQFDLDVVVPDSSAFFNAFELMIEFAPAALSLVSYQEGPLMTGACGNRFHVPAFTDSTFSVTDGLLCAGQKVHGPGTIYTLRFQAETDGTRTLVILREAGFSDAGINVTPVAVGSAVVLIGNVTGIPEDDPTAPRAGLGVPFPNPSRGTVILEPAPWIPGPVRVAVFDIAGRRLRTLRQGGDGTGARDRLIWDGRDDRGVAAPPGIYFVRLSSGGASWSRRVVRTP